MSDQNTIDILNKICRDYGLFPKRRKSPFIYWRIPKSWKGTRYAFAYTPHRTRDHTGKEGFFALKYRILKNGQFKLIKKVRFGRRKIASQRSLKWYKEYYGEEAL